MSDLIEGFKAESVSLSPSLIQLAECMHHTVVADFYQKVRSQMLQVRLQMP